MDALEALRVVQLTLFVGLGAVAVLLWARQRSRPPAYLAGAFSAMAAALVISRLLGDLQGVPGRLQTAFVVTALLAFPWLLAAMAWSFQGPLPSWLRWAAALVLGNAALTISVDVLGPTSTATSLYLAAFIATWTVLSVVAAAKLWRSGGKEQLARQRMRLMAAGLVILNVALLLAGSGVGADLPGVSEAATLLSVLSAVAFVAGFAPPPSLRGWWRRRSTPQFQRMQEALIGAATPTDVARAVAPMLAELVGGGVAVIGRDGEVEAATNFSDEQLARDRARLLSGEPLEGDGQAHDVDAHWLVVRATPYTPIFGQGERQLVEAFAIQLRLALERAELFQAHLEARAAAEAASQELEATLMGLSHDLKSPSAAIAGFADLLGHAADPDDRAALVEQIQVSAGYLQDLVDALLEFSRIGRTQLEVEPVELAMTVRSVARRVAATSPRTMVRIEGQLPVVLANPVRAEQVFDNLIGNAVKHGGRDDLTITVTADEVLDGVAIRVSDDGRGLDSEDPERLFALFARGRGAQRSGSGVGLGLVRRIVESYGGRVRALPTERGATFEVWWPAVAIVETAGSRDRDENGSVAGRPARK